MTITGRNLRARLAGGHVAAKLRSFSLPVAVLGLLMLTAPLRAAEQPLLRVGTLLALAGGLEILHGVRLAQSAAMRRVVTSGALTILMALAVINAPFLAGTAIVLVLAGSFVLDAVGYARTAWSAAERRARRLAILAAIGDVGAAVLLLAARRVSVTWLVAAACSLRAFGIAWTMATSLTLTAEDASRTVMDDLGLAEHPEAAALQAEIESEEAARTSSDRRWVFAFIITLFAIHIARMQADGSLLGLLAPAIAVLGDMMLAMLVVLVVIAPVVVSFRSSTRWLERRAWQWYLPVGRTGTGWRHRLVGAWLRYRLRIAIGLRETRYSVSAAVRRSLATGLPVAAVIAATVPVWGMSWFFDTENWASGIWNSWAESRTDEWRAAMATAVEQSPGAGATPFLLPPPATTNGDFSFIVIGDTGEGDASQHALRDQLLTVAAGPDVRFVVISSDVIYPNGAMIDYEAKFWLPFKGVTKPVYAIPGNHDWYDGLDAFLATFLQADAARTTMRARADSELRLTSTTSARIDELIAEAQRLRAEYEVPTGYQRGPFFELHTGQFSLLAIDTGIVKRIDPVQWAWLESALERAKGRFTMAVIGHPFYAGGFDETADNEEFARLKRLLVDRGVAIMMAGDTHDLEHYVEPARGGARPPQHYFVNGGGGAYMSFGTALAWPAQAPTAEWAYYPDRAEVVDKIQARTPPWKRPAWWWTRQFGAWPFSAEWMSAAFDYNVAPFFQSFIEVRVEPSARRVRLIPYGTRGRLRWREVAHSAGLPPESAGADDLVEWTVPMS
jgi:uncharacterized membrane protein HdeD (DUF308 family)